MVRIMIFSKFSKACWQQFQVFWHKEVLHILIVLCDSLKDMGACRPVTFQFQSYIEWNSLETITAGSFVQMNVIGLKTQIV